MKVYRPCEIGRRPAYVQPGHEHPVSHFMEQVGFDKGEPVYAAKMFRVEFVNGEADVDDQLGQYMIDKGIAKRSPILLAA